MLLGDDGELPWYVLLIFTCINELQSDSEIIRSYAINSTLTSQPQVPSVWAIFIEPRNFFPQLYPTKLAISNVILGPYPLQPRRIIVAVPRVGGPCSMAAFKICCLRMPDFMQSGIYKRTVLHRSCFFLLRAHFHLVN